jgi:hypothetical protein
MHLPHLGTAGNLVQSYNCIHAVYTCLALSYPPSKSKLIWEQGNSWTAPGKLAGLIVWQHHMPVPTLPKVTNQNQTLILILIWRLWTQF